MGKEKLPYTGHCKASEREGGEEGKMGLIFLERGCLSRKKKSMLAYCGSDVGIEVHSRLI